MEIKKNPRKKLEAFSKIFFEIGLALVLFIVYQLLEIKTYDNSIKSSLGKVTIISIDTEDIPIIVRKEIIIPEKIIPPPLVPEKINVVKNDVEVEEAFLSDTETDENEGITNKEIMISGSDIIEVEETEKIIEDVPFMIIQSPPIFPGCKGNKEELKKCFMLKISTFFHERFDKELGDRLQISPGKKKVMLLFTVDKTGRVTEVQARSPHPKITKEVIDIINQLPRMIPGMQGNSPVGVQFSLPITFWVQ